MSSTNPVEERSVAIYGEQSRNLYLPFCKQIRLPKPPEEMPINQTLLMESCASKIIMGGVMGAVMGVALGTFLGAMGGDVSAIQVVKGREVPQPPVRESIRAGVKSLAAKSSGFARSFGVLTALFGGVECIIEKYRAKHDVWNPVLSGCVVGAALSAKAGPVAACAGCAGFAGFSAIADKIMGPH